MKLICIGTHKERAGFKAWLTRTGVPYSLTDADPECVVETWL